MSEYSNEAQELGYAWSSVGMPIDAIAEMHLGMQRRIAECYKLFEGMTCLCAEGPECMHWSTVLDLICKEAVKGCDICKGP
jgi:hypothetical protein